MIYFDDCIMKKGTLATAGSKMLYNFTAPFTATVLSRLGESAESVALGEFGLVPPETLPNGTLLCNDIFGHVRAKCAEQGLCYIRPTYGTVSRFGLIPVACSMDQIGVSCKNLADGFEILSKIAGFDENDGAMYPENHYSYGKTDKKPVVYDGALPYSDYLEPVINILAYAEISANFSRYDGLKFGYRADSSDSLETLYTKTRTEGFGTEVKLATMLGCLSLSREFYVKYYEKAMRIRRIIKESVCFEDVDVYKLPLNSPLPQLTGLPSLTFGDAQYMADAKKESVLLTLWEGLL